MTVSLEGVSPAKMIRKWVKDSVCSIKEKYGWTPCLVTIVIGDNAASERYIRNQMKACSDAGIAASLAKFPEDIKKEDFLKELGAIIRNPDVDGVILERPFPAGWEEEEILNAIPSSKDIEGIHPENLGRLYLGENGNPLPCTAWAAISLLEWYGRSSFDGQNCVVIGRSAIVGRAVALMLMHRNGTVTVCHTRTTKEHLRKTLSGADVVIVAAGVPGIIDPKWLPPHAWVIDVGTNVTEDGKLVGDVAPCEDGALAALSPVPGGIGPMTVSMLLANLLLCSTRRRLGIYRKLPNLMTLKNAEETK